jgi:hypothetical protein
MDCNSNYVCTFHFTRSFPRKEYPPTNMFYYAFYFVNTNKNLYCFFVVIIFKVLCSGWFSKHFRSFNCVSLLLSWKSQVNYLTRFYEGFVGILFHFFPIYLKMSWYKTFDLISCIWGVVDVALEIFYCLINFLFIVFIYYCG